MNHTPLRSKFFFQLCPRTKFYPRSKTESISIFLLNFVSACCFQMAVTIALVIGLSHVQICWKAEKVVGQRVGYSSITSIVSPRKTCE
jgi:hypothetical protein